MNETKLVNVQGKGPVTKARSGRFDIAIWHWKKIIPQPEETKDLFAEREIDIERASIRYSRWNRSTRTWDETVIWCDIDDLRSLVQAFDDLNLKE